MMGVERLLSAWRSGRFGRAGGKGGGEGDRVLGMDCHYSEVSVRMDGDRPSAIKEQCREKASWRTCMLA